MDKKELRRTLYQKRKSEDPKISKQRSQIIEERCFEMIEEGACVGIYVSDAYEVGTHELIQRLLPHHRVCCPLIYNNGFMDFFEIKSFNDLAIQSYGLLEPTTKVLVQPNEIDVMIVPLVGYNAEGYRIGQGKGYYDIYMKEFKGLKIGLAYSFQKCSFTPDEFDIPCHHILTD